MLTLPSHHGKSVVFPLTYGRAALCRRLSFCVECQLYSLPVGGRVRDTRQPRPKSKRSVYSLFILFIEIIYKFMLTGTDFGSQRQADAPASLCGTAYPASLTGASPAASCPANSPNAKTAEPPARRFRRGTHAARPRAGQRRRARAVSAPHRQSRECHPARRTHPLPP